MEELEVKGIKKLMKTMLNENEKIKGYIYFSKKNVGNLKPSFHFKDEYLKIRSKKEVI